MMRYMIFGLILVIAPFVQLKACQITAVPVSYSRAGVRFSTLTTCFYLQYLYKIKVELLPVYLDKVSERHLKRLVKQKPAKYASKLAGNYIPRLSHQTKIRIFYPNAKHKHFCTLQKATKLIKRYTPVCPCKDQIVLAILPNIRSQYKELRDTSPSSLYNSMYNDQDFLLYLKKKLKYLVDLSQLDQAKKSKICICIHFREGGSFDPEVNKPKFPTKFLPIHRFTEALSELLQKIPEEYPIHVRIFSDSLTDKFFHKIKPDLLRNIKHNLTMDTFINKDPLETLSNMSKFDFLIRPKSAFSAFSEVIGNFAGVLTWKNKSFFYYKNEARLKEVMKRVDRYMN